VLASAVVLYPSQQHSTDMRVRFAFAAAAVVSPARAILVTVRMVSTLRGYGS